MAGSRIPAVPRDRIAGVSASALAGQLRQLSDLADIRGASLEASDWNRLAVLVEGAGDAEVARLTSLARAHRLADVHALHPALYARLDDLLLGDAAAVLESGRTALPWLLRRLVEGAVLETTQAAALAHVGVVTLNDLDAALREDRLPAGLPLARLQGAAGALAAEAPRVPLGRAADILEHLILLLGSACPDLAGLTPAGDVRRFDTLVGVLALAAAAPDPPAALDCIGGLPSINTVLHRTGRRALVLYQQEEVDIRVAAPDEFGTVLYAATGSAAHLASMRGRQRRTRICAREEDVYREAGLPWIPPELRQGTGEVEAAAAGALPALVERRDIRGDLHMHTTYSDGRDSIVEMVQAAEALGYEYVAITDHSERSWASRTVTRETLARQADEIARVRERFPGIVILHGIEVDIMPDGSLDFPDELLEPLDIVLASLHDPAGHDRRRLTERCLAAIRHPLVNIITHPANQMVGRDTGHDLDFPAVYEAAALTGTALEIDGAPGHLDMDGEHARAAVAAGVTVTIDSDCHRARLLDKQMRLGIGTARRGWVEARHVLNASPIGEVRAFVAAKRH